MYLGIDPGFTKTHAVLLDDRFEFVNGWHVKLDKVDPEKRPAAVAAMIADIKLDLPIPMTVSIEAAVVAGARNLQSTIKQAYVIGAIQAELLRGARAEGYDVRLVAVSSWKKAVVGHGSSTKEQVAEFVRLRWPDIGERAQDYYDAACIAAYPSGC